MPITRHGYATEAPNETTTDAARAWCEGISATMAMKPIQPQGVPYLERYFASGWRPYEYRRMGVLSDSASQSLFLHHFVGSDPADEVHSHPWTWGQSLIMAGGYLEHRCHNNGDSTTRECLPGDVITLTPEDKHRIELIDEDAWTLFLTGPFAQDWEFFDHC